MFQHRHYAEVARIIARMDDPVRKMVALRFAADLQGTNPKFDSNRFMAAAMGDPINGKDR